MNLPDVLIILVSTMPHADSGLQLEMPPLTATSAESLIQVAIRYTLSFALTISTPVEVQEILLSRTTMTNGSM